MRPNPKRDPRSVPSRPGEDYWTWRLRAERLCGVQHPQELDYGPHPTQEEP